MCSEAAIEAGLKGLHDEPTPGKGRFTKEEHVKFTRFQKFVFVRVHLCTFTDSSSVMKVVPLEVFPLCGS